MANNTVLDAGTGGDTIRTIDKTSYKTPTSVIDKGGSGAESLVTDSNPLGICLRNSSGTEIGTNANPVQIGDAGGSLTVDGTVGVSGTVTVDSELTTADLDTGAGTDTRAVVGLVLAASGGGLLLGSANPMPISASALPLPTGAATAANQVTANASLALIDDLPTVDSEVATRGIAAMGYDGSKHNFLRTGGGTETSALRVTIANNSTGVVSVDDNGSSLTVDGTVGISGTVTVDSELTTADLDTGAGTDTRAVVGLVLAASGGGLLLGTANPMPISDNGGSLTVDGTVGISGTVPVTDNSGSLTVDAPVGTPVFVRLSDGSSAISTLPVSLASVPSHAVTNAGTFATQVDGAALTALQKIDDPVLVDDAAFTPATSSVMMAGFQADESSTDSVNEGDAGAARMTLDRKLIVTMQPHTAGGWSAYRVIAANSNNAATIKNTAGKVGGWYISNSAAAKRYVKLYNKASNPSPGTDTPLMTLELPAGAAGHVEVANGIEFDTGIAIVIVTGQGDSDNNSVTAGDVVANIFYK